MREKRLGGRRLAAVVAAKMAEHSHLTRGNEDGKIALLRSLRRNLIEPGIGTPCGRITVPPSHLVQANEVIE